MQKKALGSKNHPYTVRLSQEAIELALKAALRLVGIDYPKIHDVSHILKNINQRFPKWFQEKIPFLAKTSLLLSKKRELSFYGDEESLASPDDLFNAEDAQKALTDAQTTVTTVLKLFHQYENELKN